MYIIFSDKNVPLSSPDSFALTQVKLTGEEHFTRGGSELPYNTLDFWRWASSDLASNATRGVLAEFIVAKMLGIELATRNEWDDFDLITPDGTKIEVKSSAYIQSWHQKKPSAPKFDIAKRKYYTDPATGEYKLILPLKKRYVVYAKNKSYLSVNERFDLLRETKYREIKRNLALLPIEAGTTAQLQEVVFGQSSYELLPAS